MIECKNQSLCKRTVKQKKSRKGVPDLADYPLKDVRNFAAGGGHSLLWPEATTFLSHRGVYLRPEAATVACGRRPQGFISQKSRPKSGHLVTLGLTRTYDILNMI